VRAACGFEDERSNMAVRSKIKTTRPTARPNQRNCIDTLWNMRKTEREDISMCSYELGRSCAVSCNRRERVVRVRLLSGDSNLRLSAILSLRWARA